MRPSSGRFGISDPDSAAGLAVPVSGIAGDQQAALFGQACFEPGMAKNTYGTGSFVLVNLGATLPDPVEGLLTTVAWQIDSGAGPSTVYAMEGAIFVTGAAVQWLRDGISIIDDAAEIGPLAESVPDSGGITFVPAFTGLGSPYWDPYARGTILGLSRGTGRAHLARAVVESMAYQTRDVVDAVAASAGVGLAELRVDGGASVMDVLCQFQADLLGVPVRRPAVQETTALGAAYLAGLAEGVWATPAAAADAWTEEASFSPAMPDALVEAGLAHLAPRRGALPQLGALTPEDLRRPNEIVLKRRRSGAVRRVLGAAGGQGLTRHSGDDGGAGDGFGLVRHVLRLGHVGVDVLVAAELADLVHQLVGDLAQDERFIGPIFVVRDRQWSAEADPHRAEQARQLLVGRLALVGADESDRHDRAPVFSASRATPVCPRWRYPSRVRVPSG